MDAGDPKLGAYSLIDRALPSPSPAANLVGIWKAMDRDFNRCLVSGFFISPPLPSKEELC